MSQSIETKDGGWVLVLSKEEAELLGTFRYKHVSAGCPLYNTLAALPFVEHGEYRTELHAGKTLFGVFVPVCPEPKPDVPTVRKCMVERIIDAERARRTGSLTVVAAGITGRYKVQRADADAEGREIPSTRRDVLAVAPRRWFVQWLIFADDADGWCSLVSNERRPAGGMYRSRNEAYRQLAARAIFSRRPESGYRVVPEGTADGPEKDRGYYTVQFSGVWGWKDTDGGPGTGNRSVKGRYPSAKMARDDIREYGYKDSTYRVKWHPSNS